MPPRPLLILGPPDRVARARRAPGRTPLHLPPWERQRESLLPQFDALEQAFNARRASLQATPLGQAPEHVVVLETVGAINDFLRAVQRIPGMEWLGEWDESDIPPDDDFYRDEAHRTRSLEGRLYLIMANQQAMQQFLSLWRHFQSDPDAAWEHGKTRWRDLFRHLKTVRLWGLEERLYGTGVLQDWRERVAHGQERIRTEVELWFRENDAVRRRAQQTVEDLVTQQGGRLIGQSVIPEIRYHALLAELPIQTVQALVEAPDTALVHAEQVMFFRPTGQMAAPMPSDNPAAGPVHPPAATGPRGDPVVALLDGLPIENHQLLAGRLIVDDPDGWATYCPAADRHHGTAMASLIVHGDLGAAGQPMDRPMYVRPVLKPAGPDWIQPRQELIPEGVLAVDLLHRAVRRIFDGEGDQPPAAPTVRIINFSVGDASRPFERLLSPYARLVDWLSYRYGVLFVVSAGNHATPLTFDCSETDFLAFDADQRAVQTLRLLARGVGQRRLLAPSEASNALTVGALHADATALPTAIGYLHDLFADRLLPSPISALGPGYRRSVKPDLLMPGGRQLYLRHPAAGTSGVTLQPSTATTPPGHRVASPGSLAGDLAATRHTRGTSNAAALATRSAAQLYSVLEQLRAIDEGQTLGDEYTAVLLKALLAHAASWGSLYDALEAARKTPQNGRAFREHAGRFLGYGAVDAARLGVGTDQRATMVACSSIAADDAHEHRIPLPPSLSSQALWRRLTVTLAWMTPINPAHRAYRRAALWFDVPVDPLQGKRKQADNRACQRGTLQHEVFEGSRASAFIDGDALVIRVNCRADAGPLAEPVRYALAITLEVAENVPLPIYEEIRQRIRVAVPLHLRVPGV